MRDYPRISSSGYVYCPEQKALAIKHPNSRRTCVGNAHRSGRIFANWLILCDKDVSILQSFAIKLFTPIPFLQQAAVRYKKKMEFKGYGLGTSIFGRCCGRWWYIWRYWLVKTVALNFTCMEVCRLITSFNLGPHCLHQNLVHWVPTTTLAFVSYMFWHRER